MSDARSHRVFPGAALACTVGLALVLCPFVASPALADAVEDHAEELEEVQGRINESNVDYEEAVARALRTALADKRPSVVLLLAKGDETRQHRGDSYPEVKSDLSLAREILRG